MTPNKMLFTVLLLVFSSSAFATDYYCNGQYKTSGSTSYYPNGQYMNSGSTHYYPNGQYANSGSTRYYSNGQYINSGSTNYYPNGQYANSGSTSYYPNGQYMNSGSSCYYENGTNMGSCPKSVKVKTTIESSRLTITVNLNSGAETIAAVDYEIPGNSYVTNFSLDPSTGEINDLSATCNGNVSQPGKDILDLYRTSTVQDQNAAKQSICK